MELKDLSFRCMSFEFSKTGARHTKVIKAVPIYNTPSGPYTKEEWINDIQEQIDARGERTIYEHLKLFTKKGILWLKTDEEKEEYAMQLYSNRIFESKRWVEYNNFWEYVETNTNPILKQFDNL